MQFLIQLSAVDGAVQSFSLSREDLQLIRTARPGRAVGLEHYIAYLTAEQTLALSRRPDHEDTVVVCYAALCRKLVEAEIKVAERGGGG
jgi:hypothetical protein